MHSFRPPLPRRPVAVLAMLAGMAVLLLGPVTVAVASPAESLRPPVLTPQGEATFVLGQPGDAYLIQADGDPIPAISVDTLPPGLRLIAHGDSSASLTGTPIGPAGSTIVEVRAQNAAGTSTKPLTVVVQQAPAFPERKPVVVPTGQFSSVIVRAVGYPAPAMGVEGDLPPGLALVDAGNGLAIIAGTPLGGPTSAPVTLTAVNVVADASFFTTIEVVATAPSKAPAKPAVGGPRREF